MIDRVLSREGENCQWQFEEMLRLSYAHNREQLEAAPHHIAPGRY
jgi:hypothetical protein